MVGEERVELSTTQSQTGNLWPQDFGREIKPKFEIDAAHTMLDHSPTRDAYTLKELLFLYQSRRYISYSLEKLKSFSFGNWKKGMNLFLFGFIVTKLFICLNYIFNQFVANNICFLKVYKSNSFHIT